MIKTDICKALYALPGDAICERRKPICKPLCAAIIGAVLLVINFTVIEDASGALGMTLMTVGIVALLYGTIMTIVRLMSDDRVPYHAPSKSYFKSRERYYDRALLTPLRQALDAMGKMTKGEFKSVAIFVGVLVMWVTESWHGVSAEVVVLIGAIIALMPGIGVVKWNDVDIPWHLMLFSAGAYVIGSGLNATDLPAMMVGAGMDALGITAQTPFIVLYILLTGLMLFSALIFQSKNMRALVFIPIAIGVEQQFGLPPLSLSFPVSLLIEHVYVLPFNSKPAALLYTTNHYSWSDTFKFGITMMVIAWIMILVWGETVPHWLGYTPGLF